MSDRTAMSDPSVLGERFAALAGDETLRAACFGAVSAIDIDVAAAVLRRLADGLDLSPFECDVLVLAGLPEEHEALTELARRLHPLGEPRVSFGMIAATLSLDARGRVHLRRALETGVLTSRGVLDGPRMVPLPERGLRLVEGLWEVIRGGDRWPADAGLRPLAHDLPTDLPEAVMSAALVEGPRVVLITGSADRPVEETSAQIASAFEHRGRSCAGFDARVAVGSAARGTVVHLLARGAIPVIVGAPPEPVLPDHPGPVLVCVAAGDQVPLDDRPVVEIALAARSLGSCARMWAALAPELNGEASVLAGLLRVDQLRAARAVRDARAAASARAVTLDVDAIIHRVRRRSDNRLPASVRRVEPTAPRERLVTTADNDALLRSLVHRVRTQVRVLHDWGFSTVGGVRGVRALFTGPPGTGKTLSAEITAAELGLDLLVVDLSALVSKWIGETEKNLAEVFDAAEHSQAVLFFDEADALFGKRTDANDAQARWANLETAYLLSRIDTYQGLVLLASNLRTNIDQAFVRRLDVIVEFDEPGRVEREALWRAHLPADAPLAADVDVAQLAELYPITGGVIRNAVLAAAFDTAGRGGVIGQRALIHAIRREYQKAGRSFPGVPRALADTVTGAL